MVLFDYHCVSVKLLKFNCGASSRAVVLKEIGCKSSLNLFSSIQREDGNRIYHAERKISVKRRISRQKQHLQRKLKKSDNTDYLSGGFSLSAVPDNIVKTIEINFIDEKQHHAIKMDSLSLSIIDTC